MKVLKRAYEKKHNESAPYYYDYSIGTVIMKPIRKWLTNTVASNCPFNCIRIFLYRLCGFKIGKKVFIGMHSYLDDVCREFLTIEDEATVSYGVYFACHGYKQGHYPIVVGKGAYIGMRANIISKNRDKSIRGVHIGQNAVIGAGTLVNMDIPDSATAVGVPCRIIEGKENE